jgi:hypothetical protein
MRTILDYAKKVLLAGKHAIVEKPLPLHQPAEAEELVALATERGISFKIGDGIAILKQYIRFFFRSLILGCYSGNRIPTIASDPLFESQTTCKKHSMELVF